MALLPAAATSTGSTIIMVTHEPDIAALRQRVVRLRDGRIVGRATQAGGAASRPRPLPRRSGCGMTYLDALRSALEALRANPTAQLLTTLGIIIGVAAVIIVVAIGSGARELVVLADQEPGHQPARRRAGRPSPGRRAHAAAGVQPHRATTPRHRPRGRRRPARRSRSSQAGVQARPRDGSNWPTALYGVGAGLPRRPATGRSPAAAISTPTEHVARRATWPLIGADRRADSCSATTDPIGQASACRTCRPDGRRRAGAEGADDLGQGPGRPSSCRMRTAKARSARPRRRPLGSRRSPRWSRWTKAYDLQRRRAQVRDAAARAAPPGAGQDDDFSVREPGRRAGSQGDLDPRIRRPCVGRDRVGLAAGRRHRHHEHHAGVGDWSGCARSASAWRSARGRRTSWRSS